MKKIVLTIILTLILSSSTYADTGLNELSTAFGKLSGVENALKKIGMTIDATAGADTKPDRVYAIQDMANMCKTSKMQVHSLNSLFSVVKLVKMEKKFQSREAAVLKKKRGYAFNDFNRRKAFIQDILAKAKDTQLRDLAYIFRAQLEIILEQLSTINRTLN